MTVKSRTKFGNLFLNCQQFFSPRPVSTSELSDYTVILIARLVIVEFHFITGVPTYMYKKKKKTID